MEGFGGLYDTLKDSGRAYVSNDPPAARGEAAAGGSRLTEDVMSQIDACMARMTEESSQQLEERIKRNRDTSQIVDDSRMEEEMRKWRSFLTNTKNLSGAAREKQWDKLKALIAYQELKSRVGDKHAGIFLEYFEFSFFSTFPQEEEFCRCIRRMDAWQCRQCTSSIKRKHGSMPEKMMAMTAKASFFIMSPCNPSCTHNELASRRRCWASKCP